MKRILTTPFLRRKYLYTILAAILMIGVAVGKFTPEQADTWTNTVMGFYDQLEPFMAAAALFLAARNATEAADDPTTARDVEAAAERARADGLREGKREGAAGALQEFRDLTVRAAGDATAQVESALATYRGPTSRG